MGTFRYSKWDGSQEIFELDPDELMNELSRNLLAHGDMTYSLRQMQRGGITDSQGRRLPTLQELLQKLRQKKQEQLDKYNLGSMINEIRQKLDEIIKQERKGIQEKLAESKQKDSAEDADFTTDMMERLLKTIEDRAAQNLEKLDNLPPDIGGQIKELNDYDFMDAEARRQFQELMDTLKQHAMESYSKDLLQKVKDMDPNTLTGIRNMVEAFNQMLEQRMTGGEPDFDKFMEQFGDFFGSHPPKNLDELIEHMQNQIARGRSLLESMSAEDREALESMLESALDEATRYELAKLAANLEALYPSERLTKNYPFSGKESISFSEAMKLMEELQKMDTLETQFKESQYSRSLDDIDEQLARELMGDEAAEELERLRSITEALEEAGYIRLNGSRYELTPRGMRKIGQRALEDIFAELRRDSAGSHHLDLKGVLGENSDETKKYESGDEFQIHLQKTIMNSIYREPATPPVKLTADDFEIYNKEALTKSATVLMLDMSLSMPMRGNFEAAKRVSLALDGLIRSQYPRDILHVIGFSSYARKMTTKDLAYLTWDEFDPYTNMQHGFQLARRILSREKCTNKQIIMITDGEPTAHFEGNNVFFQYPPTLRTVQLTLREVKHCTQSGIVINTFMLDSGRFRGAFVTQMAQLNKGRVFFTTPDSLGEYLMVDYLSNKKKKI